jgi:hypothetical protein
LFFCGKTVDGEHLRRILLMASQKVKWKLSIKEIYAEFEGSREDAQQLQHGVQQALGNLIGTQARLLAPPGPGGGQVIEAQVEQTPATEGNGQKTIGSDSNGQKQAKPRRARSGLSIVTLLRGLNKEHYFSEPRSGAEVEAYLKDKKGHSVRNAALLTQLQRLVTKGELHRDKNADDTYIYKDSPFDEGRGSSSPPDQPVQ